VKKADKAPDEYASFWTNFGAVLKEGLYEDGDHRADILKLTRFRSTASGDDLVSFAEYVGRMKDGQTAIYTISGDDHATLRRSPQLEGFIARNLEVLLLSDPIDDFWPGVVGTYEDTPFKSITHGAADLDAISPQPAEGKAADHQDESQLDTLIALLKLSLGEAVKDVRTSSRLTDSAVCLVADEGQVDMHLERILKQHKRIETAAPRVLEINPRHSLIRALDKRAREQGATIDLEDAAHLLLDQARVIEGEPLADPAAFARRLSSVLTKSL
jgi:molecular chaperone HtpG